MLHARRSTSTAGADLSYRGPRDLIPPGPSNRQPPRKQPHPQRQFALHFAPLRRAPVPGSTHRYPVVRGVIGCLTPTTSSPSTRTATPLTVDPLRCCTPVSSAATSPTATGWAPYTRAWNCASHSPTHAAPAGGGGLLSPGSFISSAVRELRTACRTTGFVPLRRGSLGRLRRCSAERWPGRHGRAGSSARRR